MLILSLQINNTDILKVQKNDKMEEEKIAIIRYQSILVELDLITLNQYNFLVQAKINIHMKIKINSNIVRQKRNWCPYDAVGIPMLPGINPSNHRRFNFRHIYIFNKKMFKI